MDFTGFDVDIRPPNFLLTLVDGPRAIAEQLSLFANLPWLYKVAEGDGHPVMVIPGFVGSDKHSRPLIRYLRRLGYCATGWKQGRNMGHGLLDPDVLLDRIRQLVESEGKLVTLIGHSLGGIYARELARMAPEQVRQVITLGSPFGEGRHQGSHAFKLYQRLSPHEGKDNDELWHHAPPVPTTAIYSRSDGVVNWRTSLQRDADHDLVENVEVCSSHMGFPVNPAVWYVIADRLGQDPERWKPFSLAFGWKKLMYPSPAWRPREPGY